MAHVAGSEGAIVGLDVGSGGTTHRDQRAQLAIQVVERRATVHRHVVDLVHALEIRNGRRQDVGLHRVLDVAEVARRLAVAVDRGRLTFEQRGDPARDHRGIGAARILARPEHVEVPQADGLHPVRACKHVGVKLVDVLGDRVRRQRLADLVLDLRQGPDGRRRSSSMRRTRNAGPAHRARRPACAGSRRCWPHGSRADPRSSAAPNRARP